MTPDFAAFVEREQTNLLRLAYLLTGSEADAKDVVQDCLARAYARWETVAQADSVSAYVRTMVVNSARSWWRRLRLRETPSPLVTPAGGPPSLDDAVVDAHVVWQACRRLPRRQQVAVVLRFYEDLTYSEIGEVIGCTEATARSHVFRGLRKMRRELGEEEQ